MTPAIALLASLNPALGLLPPVMDSRDARRMLLAIAYQESNLEHRRQIRGPARGYWQFELGGINGVLRHDASSGHAVRFTAALDYGEARPDELHAALEHNDVLAAGIARLLLWTHSSPLPTHEAQGWAYYMWLWRPGKPHEGRWSESWRRAVEVTP